MVAGAEQPDPVQHGIEVLVAVTDEPRAMPLPAIDALARARCRRPAAAPAARSPAGSSQCGSPTPLRPGRHRGSQRTDRERNQPLYLGGELRRDLVAEPPFLCPVVPAGGAVAAGFGGRASQIASLTATICSLTCAKR